MSDLQECSECGWCCEFPNSHIEHCGGGGCKFIRDKYDVWFNEDGELEYKLKVKTPKQKKKNMKNILDHLPYDCLQYILQFCGDHIQYDFKLNVIYSTPFQSKLKERYLLIEYPEAEEDDEVEYHKVNERYVCEHLFSEYPVSGFIITRDESDDYEIEISYRELGLNKKYVKRITKENSDMLWNIEAKEFNKTIDEQMKKDSMTFHYRSVNGGRTIKIKSSEELDDEVRERIEDDDDILYITTGFIYDNLYKKQKDKLIYEDIEKLQKDEHQSVLKAICDINGVVEDVVRYDGYEDFLNLHYCDNIYNDVYMIEYEH